VKQLKNFFRTLIVLFCIISATSAQAQQELEPEYLDSVEVSLLTCSPHEEIYSLYGHSALRWHDLHQEGPRAGEDLAFNWGIFNFDKPYFVARFVFGLTDYELGVIPYQAFCSYYEQWGSSVTEQVLNLTNEEKQKLKEALANNLLPENRIYRYNFFYDNCSIHIGKWSDIVPGTILGPHLEMTFYLASRLTGILIFDSKSSCPETCYTISIEPKSILMAPTDNLSAKDEWL